METLRPTGCGPNMTPVMQQLRLVVSPMIYNWGNDSQFDGCIFFKWVGKNHQRVTQLYTHPMVGETLTRWWFQIFVIFTLKVGEGEPILTIIFFNWVETTN